MPRSTPAYCTQQPASLARLAALTGRGVTQTTGEHQVYLVLDYSASMSNGRKMQQAKDGALNFAERATENGYAVGLVQFASSAHHAFSPKRSLEQFPTILDAWRPNGSTDMAGAIRLVIRKFQTHSGTKVLCLVTDGEPDDKRETLAAARDAKSVGIDIMAIGTDHADHRFLAELTTRDDLAVTVPRREFQAAISSMALLLPPPK